MALGSPSLFPLLFFARVSGLAVAVLVLFWVLAFKSNFLPRSSSQEHLIFAWPVGFLSFWRRGEARTVRRRLLPWHVFLELYTYGLAVATAETGLLENLTFLQTKRNVPRHCPESMVLNSLGLWLALLSGLVILAAVSPKHQTLRSKLMYPDAKCLSS